MGIAKDVGGWISRELSPTAVDPVHRRWQWKILGILAITLGILIIHLASVKGAFLQFGLSPVVYASDLEEKISDQVIPIAESVNALATTVRLQGEEIKLQGDQLRDSLQFEYAEKIRDAVQARCDAQSNKEKRRISDTIERLQAAYKNVTKTKQNIRGHRYPEPICNGRSNG